jgi:DNA-binding transcriptional regulator YhcF (GntR family)
MTEETQSALAPQTGTWPQWKQIANELEADIRYGTLPPGTRLPSIRARAKELDVSDIKIQYAYRSLAEQNLVVSQGRAGTRVSLHAASPDDVRQLARTFCDMAHFAGLDLNALEGTIRGAWRQLASNAPLGATVPEFFPFDPATVESDMTVFGQEVGSESDFIVERRRAWREDSRVDAEDDFS